MYHRMAGIGGHLGQLPCSSRTTCSWLLGTTSSQLLSISKDGRLHNCPGHAVPVFGVLQEKKCFPCSVGVQDMLGSHGANICTGKDTGGQSLPGVFAVKTQTMRHRSAVQVDMAGQSPEQFCGCSPAPLHQNLVMTGLSWGNGGERKWR